MENVVILERGPSLLEDGNRVRPGLHAGVVALRRLHERLADAVVLGAADRREARVEIQGRHEVDEVPRRVGRAVVRQPPHGVGRPAVAEPSFDAGERHVADTLTVSVIPRLPCGAWC